MTGLIDCRTQAELDAALERGDRPLLVGDVTFIVGDSATVQAWDSATVQAWDSATVHASGSATVHASDSATVRASRFVPVQVTSDDVKVTGGVLIPIRRAATVEEWCDFHGVDITGEGDERQVVLFKIVRDDFRSSHGADYTPGTIPSAADWDGGDAECGGGGLHFSPRPWLASQFDSAGTRYIACPIRLADIRSPREDDSMPEKVKARGCCAPVWECDADGEPLPAAQAVA